MARPSGETRESVQDEIVARLVGFDMDLGRDIAHEIDRRLRRRAGVDRNVAAIVDRGAVLRIPAAGRARRRSRAPAARDRARDGRRRGDPASGAKLPSPVVAAARPREARCIGIGWAAATRKSPATLSRRRRTAGPRSAARRCRADAVEERELLGVDARDGGRAEVEIADGRPHGMCTHGPISRRCGARPRSIEGSEGAKRAVQHGVLPAADMQRRHVERIVAQPAAGAMACQ